MKVDFLSYLDYFSYNSIVILSYFFICLIILIINYFSKDKLNSFLVFRRGSIFNPMNYIRLVASGFCHKDFEHFRNNFVIRFFKYFYFISCKFNTYNLVL